LRPKQVGQPSASSTPIRRWWLFGMAAVACGGLQDREHGWRVALRYALGDVAQNELMRTRRLLTGAGKRPQPSLGLFDD